MTGAALIAGGLVAGFALGLAYFALLARTVKLMTAGAGTRPVVGLYAVRIALAVATFVGLAAMGAWALLAGLCGFVVARIAVQFFPRFRT